MRCCYLKFVIPLLAICVGIASEAQAQLFQLRLVSSAYAWQRQDTIGESSNHLFGYQTAQFSLAGEHLSFHTYLQGYNEFAGPLKNEGTLRLYNFYLKYTGLFGLADVSLGRQAILAGAGTGTIDGGVVTVRAMDSRLKLLGYYGALPSPEQKFEMIGDQKNNNMLGAQVVGMPVSFGQISVSYVRKLIKPEVYWTTRALDSTYAPQAVEITPSAMSEQYVSADADVDYKSITAYGRYDYDLNQEKMARVQFFTRVNVAGTLALTGEYIHREPRLSYNSIFWVFAYSTITDYELGAEYGIVKNWQIFAKYGSVSYGDDHSDRVTLGSNWKYVSTSLSWNTGYGGDLAAVSLNAGYPLLDKKLTPTLLLSYAQYKLAEGVPLTNALSVAAGAVCRPVPVLSIDAQVQWIQNKVYNDDIRLFLRGSYYFNEHLHIF
jgi:hypothetical protein